MTASNALNKFLNEDPTFNETREQEFLTEAVEAVRNKKEQDLQTAM